MSKFTFLTEKQCFGDKKIEVIKKIGTEEARITDFSILLGGFVTDSDFFETKSSNQLEDRTGYYFTKTKDSWCGVRSAGATSSNPKWRQGGCRPVIPFTSIDKIPTNNGEINRSDEGILQVEFGYYPQMVATKEMQGILEREYSKGKLNLTGNRYTTDSSKYNEYDIKFQPQEHQEYEYNGKRFVRIKANSCYDGNRFVLSNGESYRDGDYVWVEVQPVKWLIDEKERIMLCDKIIFAGIPFKSTGEYTGEFEYTDVKRFMDDYFSKELGQTKNPLWLVVENAKKTNNENDFTFLTQQQCQGRRKLGVLQKRGLKASQTDFSTLMGYDVDYSLYFGRPDRGVNYWTKSSEFDGRVIIVDSGGGFMGQAVDFTAGARLALPFASIDKIPSNGVSRQTEDGILEVEYGHYPQEAAESNLQKILEEEYNRGTLLATGNSYTVNANVNDRLPFKPQEHQEYEYNGKKYVRTLSKNHHNPMLSNGARYLDNTYVWIEVQPIKWLVDEKEKIMISDKVLFSHIPFASTNEKYKTKNFDKSIIKKFIDEYFSREILQAKEKSIILGQEIEKIVVEQEYREIKSTWQQFKDWVRGDTPRNKEENQR